MRSRSSFLLAALGLVIGMLTWNPAVAQGQTTGESGQPAPLQNAPPIVAVVDIQRLLRDSKAAKDIRAQLEKRRSAYQEEISEQEKELRAADDELARQRAILSTDAFQQKRTELQQRIAEVQRNVETRRQQLDKAFGEAMREIQVALVQIVEEMATQGGIDIVFAKSQVVLVRNQLDITDETLNRLDARLPSVKLPEIEPASGK